MPSAGTAMWVNRSHQDTDIKSPSPVLFSSQPLSFPSFLIFLFPFYIHRLRLANSVPVNSSKQAKSIYKKKKKSVILPV